MKDKCENCDEDLGNDRIIELTEVTNDIEDYGHLLFCSRKCFAKYGMEILEDEELRELIRNKVKDDLRGGYVFPYTFIDYDNLDIFEKLFGEIGINWREPSN